MDLTSLRAAHETVRIPVQEESGVGAARRAAISIGRFRGLDDGQQGKLGIIATELASNLVAHAGGGDILLRGLAPNGVEVISIDRGPGMENPERCLDDGFSTAGTRGVGLGALTRLADTFDVWTRPGAGAALMARVFATRLTHVPTTELGVVCLPMHEDDPCGDGWVVRPFGDRTLFLVCDGLGHGAPAAQATRRVLDEVAGLAPMEPDELLLRLNAALVTTRGAAVSAAVADARTGALTFAGAGNVSGCVARDDGTSSFVAHPGTVGAGLRTTRAFSHVWPADGLLILHSDGLQTRWDLRKYPGLMRREPSLVAAVLWRDFLRGRDDVTVLVARRQEVRA